MAALSADVPAPGDYLATSIDDVAILVVRDDAGQVRVFRNACSHRGSQVATGRGHTAKVLTCPYHAWSYHLDGSLHRQPMADGCFDLNGRGYGLGELPSAEQAGVVLCRLDGRPVDASGHLGWMADDLISFDLAGHHHVETRTQLLHCNWKMVIDTFLEAYHIFSLHKATIAPVFFSQLTLFDADGTRLRFIGVRKAIEPLDSDPAAWRLTPHSTIHYLVFPNTLLVHQVDHFEVWRVSPVGGDPGRSIAETSIYAPDDPATEEARSYWRRNLDYLLNVTNTEDFPLCEQIQANLSSGAAGEVVFGRNEPALIHFHRQLRSLLDTPVPSERPVEIGGR